MDIELRLQNVEQRQLELSSLEVRVAANEMLSANQDGRLCALESKFNNPVPALPYLEEDSVLATCYNNLIHSAQTWGWMQQTDTIQP